MQNLSSQLARSVLDAAPDAMVVIDAGGTICFANRQVLALFGHTRESLIGQPVECLMPMRFRQRHPALRAGYGASLRVRPMGAGLELCGLRVDGSEFPVEISLSPIEADGTVLVAAAIRDVTDRRHAEEAVRAARDAADRANQAKSRFLATASHDLRQPLQALSLIGGAMRRMTEEPAILEALARQEQAVGSMARLLNTLLDISKLESGAIRPDPTDFTVNALFEELRAEFASLADSKGLALEVQRCEECVHSDPSLVGQVLRNLVANAIKYTRAGYVALRCLHDEPARVRIEVLDTGVGIPADQLRYIYDEFFQVGVAANATREGYGLGLSIVKRIVSLLEAPLEVQSEPGKGSRFVLTLPAGQPASGPARSVAGARTASAAAPAKPVQARILLVDDDPAVLAATRLLLRSAGFAVVAVASLEEALQAAATDARIDLLVTDYHLGRGETGTAVIDALRHALARPLKAVLMTGDTSSMIRNLQTDSLVRVASKPVNADELLAMMQALMEA